MNDFERTEEFTSRIRTLQIIVGGLCGGVIVFLLVAVFIVEVLRDGPILADQPMLISGALILTAAAMAGARSIMVPAIVQKGRAAVARGEPVASFGPESPVAQTDESRLLFLYMQAVVLAAALTEGAAIMLAMAYLLQGHWITMVAAAVALVSLALQFPTASTAEDWLERQRRLLEYDREQA